MTSTDDGKPASGQARRTLQQLAKKGEHGVHKRLIHPRTAADLIRRGWARQGGGFLYVTPAGEAAAGEATG